MARASSTLSRPGTVTVPRVRRTPLLVAVGLVVVGSLAPWIDTAFGTLSGLSGGGLWTLYAAAFGIAAMVLRRPRLAGINALVMAVPAIALPVWQLARVLPLGGFGNGWMPGFGLVAVLGGGVLALRIGLRLLRS
jgi:S1-C subfamily serine protease